MVLPLQSDVLFLRLDNREAWLLAFRPALRGFAFAYMVGARGRFPALFYYFFFATFPVSSPIDRRVRWLKSVKFRLFGRVEVEGTIDRVDLGRWIESKKEKNVAA